MRGQVCEDNEWKGGRKKNSKGSKDPWMLKKEEGVMEEVRKGKERRSQETKGGLKTRMWLHGLIV